MAEAVQQIAYSDRIIISKLDLVGAADAVAVWQRVRQLNQSARVVGVAGQRRGPPTTAQPSMANKHLRQNGVKAEGVQLCFVTSLASLLASSSIPISKPVDSLLKHSPGPHWVPASARWRCVATSLPRN